MNRYSYAFACSLLLTTKSISMENGLNTTRMLDNASDKEETFLYLPKPSMIKDVDTVTYFISAEKPDLVTRDSFFVFAEKIGKKNGAVYLPMHDDANVDAISFMGESSCDPSYFSSYSIVYEDREKKQCFRFLTINKNWLLSTFAAIIKQLDTKSTIEAKALEFNLKQIVDQNITHYGVPESNKFVFYALIDYAISALY